MENLHGSCQCGQVKFEVLAEINRVVNCHCNRCRKMNSAALSTYGVIPEDKLSIISGQLNSYRFKEGAHKHFCGDCGTAIYNKNARYTGLVMIYICTLDNNVLPKPTVNIYCDTQLHWLEKISAIPSYQQHSG